MEEKQTAQGTTAPAPPVPKPDVDDLILPDRSVTSATAEPPTLCGRGQPPGQRERTPSPWRLFGSRDGDIFLYNRPLVLYNIPYEFTPFWDGK